MSCTTQFTTPEKPKMYKYYDLAAKNIGTGSLESDPYGTFRNLTPEDIDRLLTLESSIQLAKICEPLTLTTSEVLLITLS